MGSIIISWFLCKSQKTSEKTNVPLAKLWSSDSIRNLIHLAYQRAKRRRAAGRSGKICKCSCVELGKGTREVIVVYRLNSVIGIPQRRSKAEKNILLVRLVDLSWDCYCCCVRLGTIIVEGMNAQTSENASEESQEVKTSASVTQVS
jgi:hypothetical protein